MSRPCSICKHEKRQEIDAALVKREKYRTLTARFGPSKASLLRHRGHLSTAIVKAAERREEKIGDNLLQRIRDLNARTLALLDAAERDGEGRAALAAIREVRENTALEMKLLSELPQAEMKITLEFVPSEIWSALPGHGGNPGGPAHGCGVDERFKEERLERHDLHSS